LFFIKNSFTIGGIGRNMRRMWICIFWFIQNDVTKQKIEITSCSIWSKWFGKKTNKVNDFFPREDKRTRCQFHQHFTHGFFVQIFLCEALLYLHFRFELLLVQEYWYKCTHKMLVKLTNQKKNFYKNMKNVTEYIPHSLPC